ncbi:hypothetical protein [Silvibacterium sp.]|uniref:hypothetical protein n=1 Tax=Silvibacterium sp. TaxID=1964179 RepID=UPI0039E43A70
MAEALKAALKAWIAGKTKKLRIFSLNLMEVIEKIARLVNQGYGTRGLRKSW